MSLSAVQKYPLIAIQLFFVLHMSPCAKMEMEMLAGIRRLISTKRKQIEGSPYQHSHTRALYVCVHVYVCA